MNRVVTELMEKERGRYFLLGKPFSGVGFVIERDGRVRAMELVDGAAVGEYHPICASPDLGFEQVDLTGMLSDYELPLYQGRPYSGIGYEFDNGACTREVFLKNGIIYSEVRWNEIGVMTYFDVPNDEFGEVYEWSLSGVLIKVGISTNDEFFGGLRFSDDGRLIFLSACRGFLDNIHRIARKARFFPISTSRDIARLNISEDLTLFGGDIGDAFFRYLDDSGALRNVVVLKLANVGIEFLNMVDLPRLSELHVDEVELKGISYNSEEYCDVDSFARKCGANVKVFVSGREVM
ncbi:hypothetical protein [Burkholderia ubonensis]|uniref:hypothetical protein n=1 Tax=Burkholderia ubonensis TaxID=101571 RepID=UPI000AAC2CF5|nr:hypothetical protein [Burkholderia ubonensis]